MKKNKSDTKMFFGFSFGEMHHYHQIHVSMVCVHVRMVIGSWLLMLGFDSVSQGYIDLARLDYLHGLGGENYQDYSAMGLTIQAPVPLRNNDVILTGFALEGSQISNETLDLESRNLTLNTGFIKNFRNGQSILFTLVHRMNSDRFEIASDSYQLGMAGLFTYKKTNNATYQLGFYTNPEFMGRMITPLFGIDWKITDKWRFFGVIPAFGAVSYQFKNNWQVGLHGQGLFQTYTQFESGNNYQQRSANTLSLFSDFYLTKNLVFNTKFGYQIASSYRIFENGDEVDWALNVVKFGNDRVELGNIETNTFVVSVGLVFRLDLEGSAQSADSK